MFCCVFCLFAVGQWVALWRLLRRSPRAGWTSVANRLERSSLSGTHVKAIAVLLTASFTLCVAWGWTSGRFHALDDIVLGTKPLLRAFAALCTTS